MILDKSSSNKWQIFERLVTAIHLVEKSGAKVKWDDKIEGRQFDVTIRFKLGLYEFLTVIECKDYKTPVPINEVEAFITKSADAKANKAIMVSSHGFQSGAEETAKKHNIELFTLNKIHETPTALVTGEIIPLLNLFDLKLYLTDGTIISLPEKQNELPYLVKHTHFIMQGEKKSLEKIIDNYMGDIIKDITENNQQFNITLPADSMVVNSPIFDKDTSISKISFKYKLVSAQTLKPDVGMDPNLIPHMYSLYKYENVVSGEKIMFNSSILKVGFDTQFKEGRFYSNPHFNFSYYCEKVNSDIATLALVESYQHGHLFQVRGWQQKIHYAYYYVEIINRKKIRRLQKMYTDIIKRDNIEK